MINNLTELVILLDKSGSMLSTKQQTLNGMNDYLEDLRESGEACNVTLIQFSSLGRGGINTPGDYVETPPTPISAVQDLTPETYQPNGNTPLHDSICQAIDQLGARLARMDESVRPGKVIVVIITDGFENSSATFKHPDAKARIEHQQNVYQWKFVFLGANQDAILKAQELGIPQSAALTYAQNDAGLEGTYAALGETTRAYLCCSSAADMSSVSFSNDQRARSMGTTATSLGSAAKAKPKIMPAPDLYLNLKNTK